MNIDDLKATEDKRIMEKEEQQKNQERLIELLTEAKSLYEKANVLYAGFRETLMQEFIRIFNEQKFTKKNGTNFIEMIYGEISIIFEKFEDDAAKFSITNCLTKGTSSKYSFTIEPENLDLNGNGLNVVLQEGKIQWLQPNKADLQEEIKKQSEHIEQLKAKIENLNNWELMITPYDSYSFGNVRYTSIEEVIDAILIR